MVDISGMINKAADICKDHSPEILTGIGVAGLLVSAYLSSKATLKCSDILKDEKMTKKEKVKKVWKTYIPTVVTAGVSAACVIGGADISLKRTAALSAAYSLSETALREYKDSAMEVLGEKKEKEILDNIAQKKVDKHPVVDSEIYDTGLGTTLIFEPITGKYIRSSIEGINKMINEANARMINYHKEMSINDWLDDLNIDSIISCIGDYNGWNETHLIDISWSSTFDNRINEAIPVMVYRNEPKLDFDR